MDPESELAGWDYIKRVVRCDDCGWFIEVTVSGPPDTAPIERDILSRTWWHHEHGDTCPVCGGDLTFHGDWH